MVLIEGWSAKIKQNRTEKLLNKTLQTENYDKWVFQLINVINDCGVAEMLRYSNTHLLKINDFNHYLLIHQWFSDTYFRCHSPNFCSNSIYLLFFYLLEQCSINYGHKKQLKLQNDGSMITSYVLSLRLEK